MFKFRKSKKSVPVTMKYKVASGLQEWNQKTQATEIGWPTPEALMKIRKGTFLSWDTWYKGMYLLNTRPDINDNSLAKELKVSYPTAKHFRERVLDSLNK